MILPTSSSAAKQQAFQTKLDSLISDVLTDLDGIAEGFKKAGKVTDAHKYTATALLLRTYGNGHFIQPWEMRLKKNGNSNNVFSVTRGATINVNVSKVESGT